MRRRKRAAKRVNPKQVKKQRRAQQACDRIAYLTQAASLVDSMEHAKNNAKKVERQPKVDGTGQYYGSLARRVAQRLVLRMDADLNKQLCRCGATKYVNGQTRSGSGCGVRHVTVHCNHCLGMDRYPLVGASCVEEKERRKRQRKSRIAKAKRRRLRRTTARANDESKECDRLCDTNEQ
jgi:hypothetical protein